MLADGRILTASDGKNGRAASNREKVSVPSFDAAFSTVQFFAAVTLPLASISTEETNAGKLSPFKMEAAINACPGGPGCTASPAVMRSYFGLLARAPSNAARYG